jgi:hypothetical protein
LEITINVFNLLTYCYEKTLGWVVGISGFVISALIAGPPDIDDPSLSYGFYEGLGRWIVALVILIVTFIAVRAIVRSGSKSK